MERKQLESAGAAYTYLRGLAAIPYGLIMVFAALGNWRIPPLDRDWVFVALLLVLGLTILPILRYYNENYGRVRPTAKQDRLTVLLVVLAVPLVFGGSLLLRGNVSWSLDLPVNPVAIGLALVGFTSYGIGLGLKGHHVVIFGALLVIGALPVWTGADPSNIGLLLAGLAVMVNGALDHRLFVRIFGPAGALEPESESESEDSDAGA